MSASKPEIINGVSTADEPSAAWGWHGLGKRPVVISAIVGGLFLLLMLVGNHIGHVEDVFLVVFAALCFVGALLVVFTPKIKQVKRVTAHNKPAGWVEPNWNEDQLNLTGVYANLTDSQLRSLNIDPATVSGREK